MRKIIQRVAQKSLAVFGLLAMLSWLVPASIWVSPAFAANVTVAQGTVKDSAGAAVANVRVELHTPDGVFNKDTTSNSSGAYSFVVSDTELTNNMSLVLEVRPPTGYNSPTNSPTNFTYTTTSFTTQTVNFVMVSAPKTITGFVRYANGTAAPSTDVIAIPDTQGRTQASTTTQTDGSYTMTVAPGKWIVSADINLSNHGTTHLIDDTAKEVTFNETSSSETQSGVNFNAIATTATISARFLDADGAILTGNSFRADISIRRDDGLGTTRKVSETSRLVNIGLTPGVYRIKGHHPQLSGQYFDPVATTVVVKAGDTLNLGDIQASRFGSSIAGTVTNVWSQNKVGSQTVTAENIETGDRIEDATDSNGAFSFSVGTGTWVLGVQVGASNAHRLRNNTTVIVPNNSTTITGVQILAEPMNQVISGTLQDTSGSAITNFIGTVFAEDPDTNQVFSAPVDSDGTYSLLLPQSLDVEPVQVGVRANAGESYGLTSLATVIVDESVTKNLTLTADSATISGELKNAAGTVITPAENDIVVVAVNSMGDIEKSVVGTNGTYSLSVVPGEWSVSFQVQDETADYVNPVTIGEQVTTTASTTTDFDFTVKEENAVVSGTITNNAGAAVALAPVVITNKPQLEAEGNFNPEDIVHVVATADANGNYSADVPAGDYTVYTGITPNVSSLIEPEAKTVTVAASGTADADLAFTATDATLTGTVKDADGATLTSGIVAAFTDSGKFIQGTISSIGMYSLEVDKSETWQVMATSLDDANLLKNLPLEVEIVTSSNTQNLTLVDSGINVPGPVTKTFDSAATASITLPDGGSVLLPPYAVDTAGDITVSVTPSIELKPSISGDPVSLTYNVKAENSDGVEVKKLNSPAAITVPFDTAAVGDDGAAYVQFFGENSDVWQGSGMAGILNEDNGTLTAYSSHFTPFAVNGVAGTSTTTTAVIEEHVVVTPNNDGGPQTRVFEEDGTVVASWFSYATDLRGHFEAVSADIDADGVEEYVTVPGVGFGAQVRAFEENGALKNQFFAYDTGYRGGLKIAAADLDADGDEDIIVGPAKDGSAMNTRAYTWNTTTGQFDLLDWFWFGGTDNTGVAHLTTGDVDADGTPEIIGTDGGAEVYVYDYTTAGGFANFGDNAATATESFVPYDANAKAHVATGDLDGDGDDEIITAVLEKGGPNVRAYRWSGTSFDLVDWVMTHQEGFHGGLNLAVGDVDGDARAEVTVAPRGEGGPNVRTYYLSATTGELTLKDWQFAFQEGYKGGVNVAMRDVDADGDKEVVLVPSGGTPNTRVYNYVNGTRTFVDWWWSYTPTFDGGVYLGN